MADVGTYVAMGTFALAIVGYVVKLTLAISRMDKEQRDYTDAHVDNLKRDMNEISLASLTRADTIRHDAGEMGAALRTKIHEMEVYSRDTFVRKESFELVVGRLEKSLEKMTDKLEQKIDKAVELFQRRQD